MRTIRTLILAFVVAGCAWGGPSPSGRPPADGSQAFLPAQGPSTWPVSPEPLRPAVSAPPDVLVTCGDEPFPASGLDTQTGAERRAGPVFDALRAGIATFADSFPDDPDRTWRLVGQTATSARFLAEADGDPDWISISLTLMDGVWQPVAIAACELHVVPSAEVGPATWALDPAFPAPTATSTEIHILVWERACSGGRPTTGRVSPPVIAYTADAVIITIGVRPRGGASTCPLPPGTPASVTLDEPLGQRSLFDGGFVPPRPPTSP